MSVFITFAAALLIFGAVIAIHEFGHFAVAKLCGVQVNEFSIGMGPTLIKTYRKGTQYTLRLLPVGGFVALEGEESPESEQAEGGSGDDDGPNIPPEVLAQRTGKPLNVPSSLNRKSSGFFDAVLTSGRHENWYETWFAASAAYNKDDVLAAVDEAYARLFDVLTKTGLMNVVYMTTTDATPVYLLNPSAWTIARKLENL